MLKKTFTLKGVSIKGTKDASTVVKIGLEKNESLPAANRLMTEALPFVDQRVIVSIRAEQEELPLDDKKEKRAGEICPLCFLRLWPGQQVFDGQHVVCILREQEMYKEWGKR